MGLQIDLMEKTRTTGGGRIQARCPACAEGGGDTKGEHLVVLPDGRFGCCIHPGDKLHRQLIFALVGKKKSSPVIIVSKASSSQIARQWTSVRVSMTLPVPPTAPDPGSEIPVPGVPEMKSDVNLPLVGTLGTPFSNPRKCSGRKSITNVPYKHEGRDLSVPGVPEPSNSKSLAPPVPSVPSQSPKPYIDVEGNLRIPFDSPERYHWWKGGQSIAETLREVETSKDPFSARAPVQDGVFLTPGKLVYASPEAPPRIGDIV